MRDCDILRVPGSRRRFSIRLIADEEKKDDENLAAYLLSTSEDGGNHAVGERMRVGDMTQVSRRGGGHRTALEEEGESRLARFTHLTKLKRLRS